MAEKMQPNRTYQRPPTKSGGVVNTGGGTTGKVVGRTGSTTVNNSSQGRTVPKRPR